MTVWHLGTNDGTVPWCSAWSQMVPQRGLCRSTDKPVFWPDSWCPKCSALCLRLHGCLPPAPVLPCQRISESACCSGRGAHSLPDSLPVSFSLSKERSL